MTNIKCGLYGRDRRHKTKWTEEAGHAVYRCLTKTCHVEAVNMPILMALGTVDFPRGTRFVARAFPLLSVLTVEYRELALIRGGINVQAGCTNVTSDIGVQF